MAAQYLFGFYDLFVNTIFGNILLAVMGVGLAMLIILMITKSSMNFIIIWLAFYLVVMLTFYYGTLIIALGFIGAASYFAVAIIKQIGRINT